MITLENHKDKVEFIESFLHSDIRHLIIVGPTKSGKSACLNEVLKNYRSDEGIYIWNYGSDIVRWGDVTSFDKLIIIRLSEDTLTDSLKQEWNDLQMVYFEPMKPQKKQAKSQAKSRAPQKSNRSLLNEWVHQTKNIMAFEYWRIHHKWLCYLLIKDRQTGQTDIFYGKGSTKKISADQACSMALESDLFRVHS